MTPRKIQNIGLLVILVPFFIEGIAWFYLFSQFQRSVYMSLKPLWDTFGVIIFIGICMFWYGNIMEKK